MKLSRRELRVLIESLILESNGDMSPVLGRLPAEDFLAVPADENNTAITLAHLTAIGAGYWNFVGTRSEYMAGKDTIMIAYDDDREKAENSHRAKLKATGEIDNNWQKSEEQCKKIAAAYDSDNKATNGKLDVVMVKKFSSTIGEIFKK